MNDPIAERPYEPLEFLSGSFKGSMQNWSSPEKDGFSIVEAMNTLDYITLGRTVHIFRDHANLLVTYDANGTSESLPRYVVYKLMRWGIKLGAFRYLIEHSPGEHNLFGRHALEMGKPLSVNCRSRQVQYQIVDTGADHPIPQGRLRMAASH